MMLLSVMCSTRIVLLTEKETSAEMIGAQLLTTLARPEPSKGGWLLITPPFKTELVHVEPPRQMQAGMACVSRSVGGNDNIADNIN